MDRRRAGRAIAATSLTTAAAMVETSCTALGRARSSARPWVAASATVIRMRAQRPQPARSGKLTGPMIASAAARRTPSAGTRTRRAHAPNASAPASSPSRWTPIARSAEGQGSSTSSETNRAEAPNASPRISPSGLSAVTPEIKSVIAARETPARHSASRDGDPVSILRCRVALRSLRPHALRVVMRGRSSSRPLPTW
jgi:hypothetical protein